MVTYVNIPNADIDQDSPITVALMAALRDNTSMVELATSIISNNASIDFTEFNSALFQDYVFHLANVTLVNSGIFLGFRTSSNGGSSYDAGGSDYFPDSGGTTTSIIELTFDMDNTATFGASGSIILNSPASVARTFCVGAVSCDRSSGAFIATKDVGGARNANAAVNAVRFLAETGNLSTGIITMYGILK